MIKLLYVVALIAVLTGMAGGALSVMDPDMESVSGSTRISTFLTISLVGITAGGIIAGLGGLISSGRTNAGDESRTIVIVLYIVAFAALGFSVAIATLDVTQLDTYFFDITDRVSQFLSTVLEGLLYGGILAGFALMISFRYGGRIKGGAVWPVCFYSAAVLALAIGIADAILMLSDVGDYASGAGKATFFILIVLGTGVLYAGVLAGFGAYISSLRRKQRAPCPACGRSVFTDWQSCPYCSQALVPSLEGASSDKGNPNGN